jgi:hypothetical protein
MGAGLFIPRPELALEAALPGQPVIAERRIRLDSRGRALTVRAGLAFTNIPAAPDLSAPTPNPFASRPGSVARGIDMFLISAFGLFFEVMLIR